MGAIIHRIKEHWGFRRAWREGMQSGVIEVSKLRAIHTNPKEHKPSDSEVKD